MQFVVAAGLGAFPKISADLLATPGVSIRVFVVVVWSVSVEMIVKVAVLNIQ